MIPGELLLWEGETGGGLGVPRPPLRLLCKGVKQEEDWESDGAEKGSGEAGRPKNKDSEGGGIGSDMHGGE